MHGSPRLSAERPKGISPRPPGWGTQVLRVNVCDYKTYILGEKLKEKKTPTHLSSITK